MVTYQYRTRRVIFGLFFLLVGLAFVLDGSGALRVSPNDVWPLLLIALGAGTLLNRARRLQVEEDRSAQLAVAEERVRIARELHDIVAHGVSLMTIQIAAARRIAATKPDASEQSLQAAEDTGRQTLSELDSLLAVLRGADASIGAAGGPAIGWSDDGNDPRRPLPRLADIPTLVGSLHDALIKTDGCFFRRAGRLEQMDTAFYRRELLPLGQKIAGPAIILQTDSTTVVPPGSTLSTDGGGNLIIQLQGAK